MIEQCGSVLHHTQQTEAMGNQLLNCDCKYTHEPRVYTLIYHVTHSITYSVARNATSCDPQHYI